MKAKKRIDYICGNCGMEWGDQGDADDCCKESPIEKIVWICSACDLEYETEHEANECCANQKLMIAEGIKA